MYCKNCGNEMNTNAQVCVKCGFRKGSGHSYCANCGEPCAKEQAVCLKCGCELDEKPLKSTDGSNAESSREIETRKSRLVAGLLGIFLGAFGIHNFYLGFTGKAVAQLLMCLCTCGALSLVTGVWGLLRA